MTDTTNNLKIQRNTWTNINNLSGLAVGSEFYIQNIGSNVLFIKIAITEPTDLNSYQDFPINEIFKIPLNTNTVWIYSANTDGSINVNEQLIQPSSALPDSIIETTQTGGQGLAVFVQDQATPILDVFFLKGRGAFNITTTMIVNTSTFTAVTGHGIQVDEILEFAVPNSNIFMQCKVLIVAGDIITIDSLINYPYEAGMTFLRSTDNMLVDGSVTPQIFSVLPAPSQRGDITNLNIIIETSQAMDYSSFGVLPALQKGCLLRVNNGDGTYRNIFNWKTNGQFIIESFGHYFQEKAGGGRYGFLANLKYAGQQNRGVVIRLDGAIGNSLEVVVQDNLIAASMLQFRMIAYGSEIQD